MSFTLAKRSWYPWLFLALAILVAVGVSLIAPPAKLFELLVAAMGLVAGFVYFLYSQHLQETRIFAELFRQFNERYDNLNDKLNLIVSREVGGLLSQEDTQTLFDYFNLCAEEFLYNEAGFIDEKVWLAWCRGMRYFAQCSAVRVLWNREIANGSYYGFTLAIIDNVS